MDAYHTPHTLTEFIHALRIARTSGYIMLFTFFCTLFISLESGLVYGVLASLILLLYQLSDVRRTTFELNLTLARLLLWRV